VVVTVVGAVFVALPVVLSVPVLAPVFVAVLVLAHIRRVPAAAT